MWNFSPIAHYPKSKERPEWAERLLNDSRIVERHQITPRRYDEPFLYSYGAELSYSDSADPDRKRERAGGFSFDQNVALIRAAGEAAERFSLNRGALVTLSTGCFKDESPHLSPDEFRFFSQEQLATETFACFNWTDSDEFLWTTGTNLVTGKDLKLPAQMIYHFAHGVTLSSEPHILPSTSTGAACGQTVEDSSLSGMLELLERDAFMVHYLSRTEGIRVVLRSSPLLAEVDEYLRRFKLNLNVYLLKSDFPVCPVLAIITDEYQDGSPSPWITSGLKCSFDSTRSILGAIEEACQCRYYVRSHLESIYRNGGILPEELANDVILDRALYWNRPERVKDIEFLSSSTRSMPFNEIPTFEVTNPKQGLDRLLNFCNRNGHSVYRADITAPEVREHGLVVSRIVMPTLQQFYLTEPFVPLSSSRWQTVPLNLGLREHQSQEPNAVPHFFL